MIDIKVDEAYAFDYLSILYIKKDFSEINMKNYQLCYEHLKKQINNNHLWHSIIESDEFKAMIEANKITFDAVNKAKNNEVTAQYVDKCNYSRHVAKEKFQKIFFNSDLLEQKLGYEKYK
jgi:hypothetical protein